MDSTDLKTALEAAGLSRSAYYYRRKHGKTHTEALSSPRGSKTEPMMGIQAYTSALEFALGSGLMTRDEAPSLQTFTRLRKRGIPSKVAILASERIPLERRNRLLAHAAAVGGDPAARARLLSDPVFAGGVAALVQYAGVLSPDQVYHTLLQLVNRVPENV